MLFISHWLIVLAVPLLAEALYFSPSAQKNSQKQSSKEWPSPGHSTCLGTERAKRLFQETKAGLRKDPFNFALINGTTWTVVNRSDNTPATVESEVFRSDLGSDMGMFLFGMLCEDYAEREGFYDMMFEVLDNVGNLPPEQGKWAEMKVWVTLSDHALTGTPAIADRGGPNAGVELMVRRLQANPEPRTLVFLGQLTLRYEIQMNLMGMLAPDVDNKRGAAAMAAGLAEELVYTLRTEYDLCSPLYSACANMNMLIMHHPPYAAKFKELGAPELAARAAKQCQTPVSEIILFGLSYSQAHPTGATCAYSATLF